MSVARSSMLFTAGTLLSRIAGLVRDRVVLGVFGASEVMGGFVIAFRIPNMLREMLAEGALGSAFTKVYSQLDTTDRARARRLLLDMFVLMTLVSIVVCALGIVAAPWIVELMTSEAEAGPVLIDTATGLTRLLFPFLGFMILGAVAMGALHQKGRFFLTSVSPLLFNVFNIMGALLFAGWMEMYGPLWIEEWIAPRGITGFACGVLLGGLAQLIVQLTGVVGELREGFGEVGFGWPWSGDVKKVLFLMGPMALAASAGQIKTVINNYFATTAGPGAVVWLDASFRLLHLPIGLFGVAIGAAVLPALSRSLAASAGTIDARASGEIQNAVELVLWLMAPCFAFYLVNSLPIVQTLYQSGRFLENDAEQTAAALFAYSFALLSYGLTKVMTSFYFALERTGYALRVSLATVAINASVNWYLVTHYGHTGLAYGYSVTQALGVVLLILGMRGHGVRLDRSRFLRSFVALSVAGVVGGVAMLAVREGLAGLSLLADRPVWMSSGLVVLVNGLLCVAVFAACGLVYLRMTPRAALLALKGRRRRP